MKRVTLLIVAVFLVALAHNFKLVSNCLTCAFLANMLKMYIFYSAVFFYKQITHSCLRWVLEWYHLVSNAAFYFSPPLHCSAAKDVTDLFGTDLPIEGGKGGEFAWRDGPFLSALKAGHWIVLDEVSYFLSFICSPVLLHFKTD